MLLALNVAVTVVGPLGLSEHGPVPLQGPPLQPAKTEPEAGLAASVTAVPAGTAAVQLAPHVMPVGELVTVPVPVPVFVTVRLTGARLNVAVIIVAAFTVTTQLPVPEHAPPQPAKVDPALGVAVSVICVPGVTFSPQSAPQAIPAGLLLTVPVPVPFFVTVSPTGTRLNVAVTVVAVLTVTVQEVAVPEQPPLQPAKTDPGAAAAVSVNGEPGATSSAQSAPHEIPVGTLVTAPVPVPVRVTESLTGTALNVAVTAVAALTVTVQEAVVPEQAPPQPANVEPAAAAAVSVTGVPTASDSLQSPPQAMPAGELTVPAPVPFLVTVSITLAAAVDDPLTARVSVSPPAVTLTLPAKLPTVVGRKRTVTFWLAPPASEKLPPETRLKGAPTLTDTDKLAVLVFCTVKVRSTLSLTATLPKLVVPVGETVKSAWAAPLAELEQPLSLPELSTAVTRAKYVVPAPSPVTRVDTTCPALGADAGVATVWNEAPGQAGAEVPR
jgi:hypothetical protein